MPRVLTIIGSTRPGRSGLPIARWFAGCVEAHGGFELDLADLAEVGLPFLDEAAHPRMQKYEHQHTKDWSARVDAADAVVLVTAEYNHGYPAPLKNALDAVSREWADKPVGFVSYGGVAGGTRAVQQLKPVVLVLGMHPVGAAVTIPFHAKLFGEDGVFAPTEQLERSATALLDDLARVEAATRVLRQER